LTESHIHLQHKTAVPEARSNIDNDVGEVDKASMHIVENDPSFFNNILPLPATTHGILIFLFSTGFRRLYPLASVAYEYLIINYFP